jgi:hypothetical protein
VSDFPLTTCARNRTPSIPVTPNALTLHPELFSLHLHVGSTFLPSTHFPFVNKPAVVPEVTLVCTMKYHFICN